MSGSTIVDVAIGLALTYLILSLLCTALQEWLAQIIGWRSKHLEASINYLLNDGTTSRREDAQAVLGHPLVTMLTTKDWTPFASISKKPAYIPARNFALALIATLKPQLEDGSLKLSGLRAALQNSTNESLKKVLQPILETAGNDIDKAIGGIEAWYDSAMDRASGWYARQVRWVLLAMGIALAAIVNADSVQIASHLAADDELRLKVAAYAATIAPPGQDEAAGTAELQRLREELARQLADRNLVGGFGDLPVGWALCGGYPWEEATVAGCYPDAAGLGVAWGWPAKILGLLLTGLAASLGAPFWFGLLQQLNAARAAGPRPTASTSQPKA